jgi:hypothetical protein
LRRMCEACIVLDGAAMPFPRFASFAAVVAGGLFASTSARAEAGRAPPRCEVALAPRNGIVVPANVPALVATPTIFAEGAQRVTITTLVAVDGSAAGTSLASSFEPRLDTRAIGATLFVATSPPPAGSMYEAVLAIDCAGVDTTSTVRFATTEPSPLPTAMGSISTRAGEAESSAEILIDATPELLAFLPVTMFEIETRLGRVVAAGYGDAQLADGKRVSVKTPPSFPYPLDTLCAERERGTYIESMSLHAHVAGAETDPPAAAFDIAITCPRGASQPEPSAAMSDDMQAVDEDYGCATTPNAPRQTAWASFAAFALAIAAALRARRSSP